MLSSLACSGSRSSSTLVYQCFFIGLILSAISLSCKTNLPRGSHNYDETVNQQFWTADWSFDDKYIAVGGVDSILRIYDNHLNLLQSYPIESWIHSVKWNPKSNILAIATLDKYVSLLSIQTKELKRLAREGGSRAIGWNHDGTLLAVGELEAELALWNGEGRLLKHRKFDYGSEQVGTSFLSLDWHPREDRFVATNFQISIFDTSLAISKTMEHTNKAAIILSVAWHPGGSYFVIGDYGHNWEGENVPSLLHFWQPDGILVRSVAGSEGPYRNMDWNEDGSALATASDVLRIWNSEGLLLYKSKPDGPNFLWGVSWNRGGQRVVTASRFKTISLWDEKAVLLKRLDLLLK